MVYYFHAELKETNEMTNTQTPPPELVQQWYDEARDLSLSTHTIEKLVATRAAQWGADQELEACCEWLHEAKNHGFGYDYGKELAHRFRSARRPKPPTLKQQALNALQRYISGETVLIDASIDTIRRALEQLPND